MNMMSIGQPVRRVEDERLLRGHGRYTDDVDASKQARAFVLRSPHAHADILAIDTSAARSASGVLAIFTGQDLDNRGLGTLKPIMPSKRSDGSPGFVCTQPLLAQNRVRFVGEAVAFVVAETAAQAKDAAEIITVDYATLPAVVKVDDALSSDAISIWEDNPGNEAFTHEVGDAASVDAAFSKAVHTVRHRVCVNRVTGNPIENRGCIAEYDAFEDRYTLRATIQSAHGIRAILAGQIFDQPQSKFRVICDNMGGGFGTRGGCHPEYGLSLWASEVVGRPVKWIAERSEGVMTDEQGRGGLVDAELALDENYRFLGLRTHTKVAIGAYFTSDRNIGSTITGLGGLAGVYMTPAIHARVTGVLTNIMTLAQYRGGAKPEPCHIIEVMVDQAARELGIDVAELRRRNMITPADMPFRTALGYLYDCGEFSKNLDGCLEIGDYEGFKSRHQGALKKGKYRGIGMSNTISGVAQVNFEHAEVRFDSTGGITLLCGAMDHGQGHQTTFRQVLSDKLGIDADLIEYRYGDTDKVTTGVGTFNARCAVLAGSAVVQAAEKIIDKGKRIAGHMLEAADSDIEYGNGKFSVIGTDRSLGISEVAKVAFQKAKLPPDIEPGLYEHGDFGSDAGPVFPNGAHLAEVEIDAETGKVELIGYFCVDDAGTILNPLLFDGQVHGGIVQGTGQILMEDVNYDPENGQLLSGSFMDYAMPRASDFCHFELVTNEVPTKHNPLGVKGVGEAGTVGSMPAVMNAVNDALHRIGAPQVEMPATAEKVWRAVQERSGI